jgi:phosphoglucosamine mutase
MTKLFGTDGIRAVAGEYPLDPPSVRALGRALASLLHEEGLETRVIIGRDTRESGTWMERALVLGFGEGGGDAVPAGVLPTSAVSYLTRKHAFAAGIVLSASHNPYHDNGIKIFSAAGTKIGEAWEARLEDAILRGGEADRSDGPSAPVRTDFLEEYTAFLEGLFPAALRPARLRVVLDCSNGASSAIAPRVFRDLGFEVVPLHDAPDGKNINRDCGSLHPRSLAAKVRETGAAFGVAYDGDADRAVWADETGRVLNGDHTLFAQAAFMSEGGRLRSGKVVATSMSNMGLEIALRERGIGLVRTRVGDKYVLEEMIRLGANLGGEQSGHTIFLDDCPTGDGILTSLRMAEAMIARGTPLSRLVAGWEEYPQILLNVKVARKAAFDEFPEIPRAFGEIRDALGANGRLDLRYSVTEPLARIMVEGRDRGEIEKHANRLAAILRKYLA